MRKWAKAQMPREQCVLIAQTLDDLVAEDHPVRVLDALLGELDWEAWERCYDGHVGQPAYHPSRLAGLILYGLARGIRSSRGLEEATRERLDVMWLMEKSTVDHSTIAGFRTRFASQLKDLHRQIAALLVRRSGGKRIVELIVDGTRLRANSDRHGARTAEALERLAASVCERLDAKLEEMAREDESDDRNDRRIEELEKQIDTLRREKGQLARALETAHERDAKKQEIFGKNAKKVRVPVTDPESTLLPNKEGGYAPNYSPVAAVDGASGAIVSSQIVEASNEPESMGPAVEDCVETMGERPERVLADQNFAAGAVLESLEETQVDAYMPTAGVHHQVERPDPTQPVAEEDRAKLPRKGKRLSHRAFIYDPEQDCYFCPMGKRLEFRRKGTDRRTATAYRSYACAGKAGCPLAEVCVKSKAKSRTVRRDIYQPLRDRVDARMRSETGRAVYRRRAPGIEVVFAHIKHAMGVRQFLLRGLAKVRTEWTWVCAAYNIKKLLGLAARTERGPNAAPPDATWHSETPCGLSREPVWPLQAA